MLGGERTYRSKARSGAPAWGIFIAILALSITLALVGTYLHHHVQDHLRSQTLLYSIEEDAAEQAISEYEAINEGELTPEIADNVAESRLELAEELDELERLNPGDENPTIVGEALSEYEAAVDEELRLIAADQLEQADIVDEEQVDPGFEALQEILEDTNAQYGDEARLVDRIVDAASYGTALLTAITLIMIVWSWQREQLRRSEQEALRQSENRFRSLVQNASDVIMITGTDGTLRYISPAVEQVLGYKPEDIVGTDSFVPVHPDDEERVQNHFWEIASKPGVTASFELRLQHVDGSWRHIESICTNLLHDPAVRGLVVNSRDVTERKRAEEELRKSEATNRAILEATPDLIFRVSRDGVYLDFRANDDSKLYVPRGEIVGKNVNDTMPPDLVAPILRNIARTLDTGEMQVFEYQLPMADEVLDYEARLVVSGVKEVLTIVRDVTERKVLERRLEHQAFHDALTGLPNRALFTDRLEHAMVRAGRHQESVAVLFLDLDNFKVINDSLGHEAGDQLLVAVAERLQTYLRSQDTLARLSGDEFTILLEDIEGISDATEVAERVEKELRDPFEIKGQEVFVTASIGITLGGSDRDLPGILLRNADLAMYQAKDTGKARYEIFEPGMNERALERLKLENELRRALEKNEFRVYYQPKLQLVEWNSELQKHLRETNGQTIATPVALPTPRIVGAEALIRWEHPERGLVLPDQFVPIAEETGLIVPIGRWVLGEACRQARQWQECHPSDPPLTVCVNLPAREFQQPDLADAVAERLHETGLNPCSLEIEITESLLMEDTQHTIDMLRALKELGVQLSIDDFGTGYSSLSYLKRFPVNSLKIDKTFIDKLGKNYEDTVLVSSTINLSRAFGLRVLAEGVETADQLQQLRKLGCDQVQGHYFSKPLPSQDVSAMLVAGSEDDHSGLSK